MLEAVSVRELGMSLAAPRHSDCRLERPSATLRHLTDWDGRLATKVHPRAYAGSY